MGGFSNPKGGVIMTILTNLYEALCIGMVPGVEPSNKDCKGFWLMILKFNDSGTSTLPSIITKRLEEVGFGS